MGVGQRWYRYVGFLGRGIREVLDKSVQDQGLWW